MQATTTLQSPSCCVHYIPFTPALIKDSCETATTTLDHRCIMEMVAFGIATFALYVFGLVYASAPLLIGSAAMLLFTVIVLPFGVYKIEEKISERAGNRKAVNEYLNPHQYPSVSATHQIARSFAAAQLLAKEASKEQINRRNARGEHLIQLIMEMGDIETFRVLASKVDFTEKNARGSSLFLSAVKNSNANFLREILKYVKPTAFPIYEQHKFLLSSAHLSIMDLLLKEGINIDGEDTQGYTPLLLAVKATYTHRTLAPEVLVKALLERGADASPFVLTADSTVNRTCTVEENQKWRKYQEVLNSAPPSIKNILMAYTAQNNQG